MTPTELLTLPLYLPKATDRNRTGNLQITNQVLCQLSYGGGVCRIPKSGRYVTGQGSAHRITTGNRLSDAG